MFRSIAVSFDLSGKHMSKLPRQSVRLQSANQRNAVAIKTNLKSIATRMNHGISLKVAMRGVYPAAPA